MSAVPHPHDAEAPRVEPPPKPDKAAMRAALDAMFSPDDVIELRALHKGRKRTDAGYFDGEHREGLVNEAARLNGAGAAVYVNLNRIDAQLLGRYSNRIQDYAKETVTDKDVIRRRGLLIDFDAVRPANTSATDVQVAAAKDSARSAYRALSADGWPRPMVAESGNGMHMIFPIDLPNDDASRDLIKGALAGLAARFDTDLVRIDQTVYNAGRVTKLYGSVANKGDHTSLTPWRLSRLVSETDPDLTVTAGQLRALRLKGNGQSARDYGARTWYEGKDFDVPGLLADLDLSWKEEPYQGGTIYKLDACPFNREHIHGEAAVIVRADGKICFHCFHNGCIGKGWQDVRALRDGPREARESADPEGSEPQPLPEGLPKVAAFDFALLPSTLRPWAEDICERIQCAGDYVGTHGDRGCHHRAQDWHPPASPYRLDRVRESVGAVDWPARRVKEPSHGTSSWTD